MKPQPSNINGLKTDFEKEIERSLLNISIIWIDRGFVGETFFISCNGKKFHFAFHLYLIPEIYEMF